MVKLTEGLAHPCIYVEASERSPDLFKIEAATNNVKVRRTDIIDLVVKEINAGKIIFYRGEHHDEVLRHLQAMKRVEGQLEEDGEMGAAHWRKLSLEDHFFHALIYLRLAIEIDDADESAAVYYPVGITGAAPREDTPTAALSQLVNR